MKIPVKQSGKKFITWFKGLKWYKWIVVVLLILVPMGIALGSGGKSKGQIVTGVLTEKVKNQYVERVVATSGRLDSASKQEFFAPEDSTLMQLSVKVGDPVKKGQVLGRLDTAELVRLYEESRAKVAELEVGLAKVKVTDDGLSLAAAEANYRQQANKLQRTAELVKAGALATAELESARSDYARAKAEYEQSLARSKQQTGNKEIAAQQAQLNLARQQVNLAEERMQMGTFIAQADGVVLEVGAQAGARVISGTRIMTIGSRKDLEVTCKIGEIDAGNLMPGQAVKISCSALPGQEFKGKVTRVADAAVVSTGGQGSSDVTKVPVTVKLDGEQSQLKPGYSVDMRIITRAGKRALALPFDAVVEKKKSKVVFVVDPKGMVTERKVITSEGNEMYDLVTSGLKAGEEVVLSPPPNLKTGMQIIRGAAQ